jgi:hypothetical protein
MNNWLYHLDDGSLEVFPYSKVSEHYGFIYKITNMETGKFYIGKKSYIHNKKKKLGKKELLALPTIRGRKPTTKTEQVDSGWKTYWGSSKELLADIKLLGEDKFERVILKEAKNKKQLTFLELQEQIIHNVLLNDNSYNDNILGKFYRKDLEA